jgi:hypothetical protein
MLRKVFKDVLDDKLQISMLLDPECFGKLDVALDEAFPEARTPQRIVHRCLIVCCYDTGHCREYRCRYGVEAG